MKETYKKQKITFSLNALVLKLLSQEQEREKGDKQGAIILNTIPLMYTDKHKEPIIVMGEFRYLVWQCRNKAVFGNRTFTQEKFLYIFKQKLPRMSVSNATFV